MNSQQVHGKANSRMFRGSLVRPSLVSVNFLLYILHWYFKLKPLPYMTPLSEPEFRETAAINKFVSCVSNFILNPIPVETDLSFSYIF